MGKTVLLAEDDPLILGMLSQKLLARGMEVHTARDGEEAIALLNQRKPDVLVLDVLMPKVNGIAVLEHLQAMHSDVPVIIITNLSKNFDQTRCAAEGVREVVIKSDISLQQLADKIGALVG